MLIAQLYSQLNIEEHQRQKEQDLLKRLENVKAELEPFEEVQKYICVLVKFRDIRFFSLYIFEILFTFSVNSWDKSYTQ